MTGEPFSELETPAALVDLDRVEANLHRAAEYCQQRGFAWRPHTKTHKTPEVGAMQLAAGAVGLTVATLREAETMSAVCDDLLLAYPPVGEAKLRRLGELPEQLRLSVALDSAQVLRHLADHAWNRRGSPVGVLVELDLGMGRVGVGTPAEAVALAREAAELEGADFRGVLFYPGHLRGPLAEQGAELRALGDRLAPFLDALAAAGIPAGVVSGGSTPSFWRSHEIAGVNELRPGTNVFNDRTTALVGACAWDDCAYSVLATVVSTAVTGQAVIDAGSKALAKEELRAAGGGFGALLDRPEIAVRALSEEHGILDLSGTDWRPEVGTQVRVVPNHVCVSVNLHERLWAIRSEQIEASWGVVARGRSLLAGSSSG